MNEVGWVQRRSAVLTLISVCPVILTAGTGTSDIAVGEELLSFGVIILLALLLKEFPLIIKGTEERSSMLSMSRARRTSVDIEGNPEVCERLTDDSIIAVDDILRGDTFLLGLDSDGDTMLIATADEEYLFAL